MFVYVVVVLEVPVAIVDMVDVVVVRNWVAMHHRLVSVTREVFVVGGFGVLVGCHRSPPAVGPYETGDSGDFKHNDNHCQ